VLWKIPKRTHTQERENEKYLKKREKKEKVEKSVVALEAYVCNFILADQFPN
jgi:hypothetical protein